MVGDTRPLCRLDISQHGLQAGVQLMTAFHEAEVLAQTSMADMTKVGNVGSQDFNAVVCIVGRTEKRGL